MSEPHQIVDHYVPPSLTGEEKICPCCRANWQGKEIPVESRKHYGTKTHFSNLIGIEIRGQGDCVSAWECPSCHTVFPRKYVSEAGQFRTCDVAISRRSF
jgi:hypothetical protein